MRDWKVQLNVIDEGPTDINYTVATYNELCDISYLNNQHTPNWKGHKGFFFSGGDKEKNSGCWLDGSFKFFDSQHPYEGLLGTELSRDDGSFLNYQNIRLQTSGSKFKYLFIFFDKVAGEYATQIIIGNTLYNNRNFVFVADISALDTNDVTVSIIKWSRPNCVVKVLGLVSTLSITYTRKELQSLEYSDAKQSGNELVSFGILTQTGSFTVKDNGTLRVMQEKHLLPERITARIFDGYDIDFTLYAEDFEGDDYSDTWQASLVDGTVDWEEIAFAGIKEYGQRTLDQLLKNILGIEAFTYESNAVENRCRALSIPASYMNPSTKWQALLKCCNIGMLRIYKVNNTLYVGSLL